MKTRKLFFESGAYARLITPFIILHLSFIIFCANGQSVSQEEAVEIALKNNQHIKSAGFGIEYYKQLKKTGTDIGKLSAVWMRGQYNSIQQDNNFSLSQTIPFPTTLANQVRLGKEQIIGGQKNLIAIQNEIVFQVKSTYEQLLYQDALRNLLLSQDSLYHDFVKASLIRFKTGESNLLEKTTAETQSYEVKNQLNLNEADIKISATHLQVLLKADHPVYNSDKLSKRMVPENIDTVSLKNNPQLNLLQQQVTINDRIKRVEKSKILPDISVGYFTQSLTGFQNVDGVDVYFPASRAFQGFELGLNIPLWIGPHLARAKAAFYQQEASRKNVEYYQTTLQGNYLQALRELDKNLASLSYYESSALKNADLLITQSRKAYRAGEIGYVEYLQSLKTALSIKNNYLLSLTHYNQSIIKLEFLLGKI
ncbi:MAG: TolC family protein [Cyclobacteriaceae bacterium]|nr:TolC family protein [Cyclobacteriaceae bacterium]